MQALNTDLNIFYEINNLPSYSRSISKQLKSKFFGHKNTHHTCMAGSKYKNINIKI